MDGSSSATSPWWIPCLAAPDLKPPLWCSRTSLFPRRPRPSLCLSLSCRPLISGEVIQPLCPVLLPSFPLLPPLIHQPPTFCFSLNGTIAADPPWPAQRNSPDHCRSQPRRAPLSPGLVQVLLDLPIPSAPRRSQLPTHDRPDLHPRSGKQSIFVCVFGFVK